METMINRVETRMSSLGFTPAEFSRRMGELPQTFNNWRKRGNIPGNKLFKAAEVLECNARWLSDGTDGIEESPGKYSVGLNKSAIKDAIAVIKFIENKTQSELSIDEWTGLFSHFYKKYDAGQRAGTEVDKAELVLDYPSIIERIKNNKQLMTEE